MAVYSKPASAVFAPVNAVGAPRGANMGEAMVWGTELERAIEGAAAGQVDQVTWAALNAIEGTRAGQPATVVGPDAGTHTDPVVGGTVANVGEYVWSASPAGWRRVGDLQREIVSAINTGVGTGNAVQAIAGSQFSAAAYAVLITVNFVAANTGAMTLSIDGEAPRALITNTGAAIPAGYVQPGMAALVQIDADGNYRMFSYGDASAIQAAAEAAQAAAEEARDAAFAAVPNVFPVDRAAMRVVDTAINTAAYLRSDRRTFLWNGADLSAQLVLASVTTTAVNSSTETCTAAAHGQSAGTPVIVSNAVNGLALNTIYYLIVPDANSFKLASSSANAAAGTAIDLTGTTNFTIKVLADPDQSDFVLKTGANLDGSQGAWVGDDAGAPQGKAIGGFSYTRRSAEFKAGSPMLPAYFGVTNTISDAAIQKNTAGFQDLLDQPYRAAIPGDASPRLGPLTLKQAGCKNIDFNGGSLVASATGQKLLVTETGLTDLVLRNAKLVGAGTPGQTAGASTNGLLDLVEAVRVKVYGLDASLSLYTAVNILGGSDMEFYGGNWDTNLVPVQLAGAKRVKFDGQRVNGSILTAETFKTGPQCRTAVGHAYGVCEDITFENWIVRDLGNAQAALAHAGKRISWINFHAYGCATGITAGSNDVTDTIRDALMLGCYADCDVPALSAAQIAAATAFRINGHPGTSGNSYADANPATGKIIGCVGERVNKQEQDMGFGGIYVQFTNGVQAIGNRLYDCYGNGILDVSHNKDFLDRDNQVILVTGTSSGKGYARRYQGATSVPNPQSVNTRVYGGVSDDCATAFRNETANASGTVYIDPTHTIRNATIPQSGFNTGYGPNVKVVTSGTDVDLSNCDTIIFAAGSSHTISTVSNAMIGKSYEFVFTNANTTISSAGTIYTDGGTDIVGANRKSVIFRAMSQTTIQQKAPAVTSS